MDNLIVISSPLRKDMLSALYWEHQGVTSMQSRANTTIYWPGMNRDIRTTRCNFTFCNEIPPKQQQEPLVMAPSPSWPFQQIYAEYFEFNNHHYLAIVDCFSCWLNIYHFNPTKAVSQTLITIMRALFLIYEITEEISTYGGPKFSSSIFAAFLSK